MNNETSKILVTGAVSAALAMALLKLAKTIARLDQVPVVRAAAK